MNDVFIKICGITRLIDAVHAMQQGATALGFVFWPGSPRVVSRDQARDIVSALPGQVTTVGVFVNESVAEIRQVMEHTGISVVQLHGDELPEEFDRFDRPLLRSVSLNDVDKTARAWRAGTPLLLDVFDPVRRGGTGAPIDWARASDAARHHRIVLAGGLTPQNVEEAIRVVRPFGVDVSSGVEAAPGLKDSEKVSLFVAHARRAFAAL